MLRIINQIQSNFQYVPLKQVNIDATISSFAADVTITQIFRNDTILPIEAIYCFPIEEQAAIYNFTARIDHREIIAQLKEKENIYSESIDHSCSNNLGTYFLEQDEKSQDNFIINVGALPPSKECTIIISYVTELDLIQESIIRFVIPATIAPRYSPQRKGLAESLRTKSKYVQSNPYGIHFHCRIEKLKGSKQEPYIARLTSPSHHVDIDLSHQDIYLVTFDQNKTYLDRDILIDIKLSDKRANTFVIFESNAAMAAVTPFEEDCYLNLDHNQTNEFIFILDCSSSMRNENKIGLAREAMLFFLRNLPQNCYFNIIKFGTRYTCLFNESIAFYNNVNAHIAEKFISQIRADLGGTEILAPLQWLERHPPQTDHVRQVFLLTDGQISNVSEVLELCRSMASSTRIFSFGLGATPSRALVKGLARTTNGRFVFIPPNTNIDTYIGEQLQKAIRRCITNVHVEWHLGITVENVPNQLPPVYIDDRLIIYALTNNQSIPVTSKSSIEIRTDQSYYRLDITESDRLMTNNKMIERLAAKALILQLEHSKISRLNSKRVYFQHLDNESIQIKQTWKQRIIDLSLRYNILSPYTAFVGIEKNLPDSSYTSMIYREVPIEIFVPSIEKTVANIKPTNSTSSQYLIRENLSHSYTSTSPWSLPTTKNMHIDRNEAIDFTDAKNTIYYLMRKQAPDGLWCFVSNNRAIKDLTGKSLVTFQTSETYSNPSIIVTAIIMILLESKFSALRSMWEDMFENGRRQLINLLNNDWRKLVILFRDIRLILNE